jgi:hypothetical protein
VIDERYDAGAIEIWSNNYDAQALAARIDLEQVNQSLARVDPTPFTR